MALTAIEAKNAKASDKPRKLSDGGGIFLLVNPNGAKYWRLAYRYGGKQKVFALGVFPDTRLSEVRIKREEARRLVAYGVDPSAAEQATKAAVVALVDSSLQTLRSLNCWRCCAVLKGGGIG